MKVSTLKYSVLVLGFLSLVSCAGSRNAGYYKGGQYDNNIAYPAVVSNQEIATAPTGEEIPPEPDAQPEVEENKYISVEENDKSNVSLTSTSFAYPVIRECINNGNTYSICEFLYPNSQFCHK